MGDLRVQRPSTKSKVGQYYLHRIVKEETVRSHMSRIGTSLLLSLGVTACTALLSVAEPMKLQVSSSCDPKKPKTVVYQVRGGPPKDTFIVDAQIGGCIDTEGTAGDTLEDLVTDVNGFARGSVGLSCLHADDSGQLDLTIKHHDTLKGEWLYKYKCIGGCGITLVGWRLPALTNWGLIILLALLILSAIIVIRNRRKGVARA